MLMAALINPSESSTFGQHETLERRLLGVIGEADHVGSQGTSYILHSPYSRPEHPTVFLEA